MTAQDMSRNEAQGSRALVVVTTQPQAAVTCVAPADAAFVTQLLACRAGVPAYRARRRAEPVIAATCYRAALSLVA